MTKASGCRVLAATLLLLLGVRPVPAQSPDELKALKRDVEALKAGQAAMQRELQELKALVRGRRAAAEPGNVVVGIDAHPAKGDAGAKVALIEFSDYQCPFCGRYFRETLPQIEREYVETGKLRYVFRNFPLEVIHPHAFKAAEAAACAGEQGKYWAMHDQLFAHQGQLAPPDLVGHAEAIALDVPRFRQCLDGGAQAAEIRHDLADGEQAGVQGTPTFFLGVADAGGKTMKVVRRIQGAQEYSTFKEAIDSLVAPPQN